MTSFEYGLLSQEIERIRKMLASAFDMNRILLGFIIDKGLMTPEETLARLQAHLAQQQEGQRDADSTLFLYLMVEAAKQQLPPEDQDAQPKRPDWFRGVVEGPIRSSDQSQPDHQE